MGRAVATSGSAVCFAGMTVLIALAALSIVNIPFLTVMGLAAAGAVVVAVLAAHHADAGTSRLRRHRLISRRWARHKIAKAAAPGYEPLSWRYVMTLKRAPILVVLAGDRRPAVRGHPVLQHAARPARRGLAAHQPDHPTGLRPHLRGLRARGQRPAAHRGLRPGRDHPGPEAGLHHLLRGRDGAPPPRRGGHRRTRSQSRPRTSSGRGDPEDRPNAAATTHLIHGIRTGRGRGQKEYGLDTYVTGQTALNIDISAKLSSALPLYLAIIIILCLLLLILVFRSLLVPLAAVVGYVLSILAALGAVTFVFQEGHLSGMFGIARPGPVLSFLPIILLGILFGLAMDYEVFLESRMREESLRKDATTAVTDGYRGSAKVVGSAAIIMVSVFASFIVSPDPTTKSLGFALALGVLIDAFVVRMTVVPASMYIFKGTGVVAAAMDAPCPARPRHRGKQAGPRRTPPPSLARSQ